MHKEDKWVALLQETRALLFAKQQSRALDVLQALLDRKAPKDTTGEEPPSGNIAPHTWPLRDLADSLAIPESDILDYCNQVNSLGPLCVPYLSDTGQAVTSVHMATNREITTTRINNVAPIVITVKDPLHAPQDWQVSPVRRGQFTAAGEVLGGFLRYGRCRNLYGSRATHSRALLD